jgi:endonuclease YncB( thermonuclease family)
VLVVASAQGTAWAVRGSVRAGTIAAMVVVFAAMHNTSLSLARLASVLAGVMAIAGSLPAAADDAAPADLPTVVVGPHIVHAVPDQEPPPPPVVTLRDRDGNAVAWHAPPPVRRSPSAGSLPVLISGEASMAEGLSLSLRGRALHLFGVRLAPAGDRCAAVATGAPGSCDAVAREALATRLRINDDVSCRVPPGQSAVPPGAVCRDASGVDLGGLLVAQGLVLADPAQSYEYVGAETAARTARRGLWNYR